MTFDHALSEAPGDPGMRQADQAFREQQQARGPRPAACRERG
jgi:hypothetical protein